MAVPGRDKYEHANCSGNPQQSREGDRATKRRDEARVSGNRIGAFGFRRRSPSPLGPTPDVHLEATFSGSGSDSRAPLTAIPQMATPQIRRGYAS